MAADESAGPWLRAGHAEAAKIPDAGLELLIFCGLGVECFPVRHGLAWIENMSQILRLWLAHNGQNERILAIWSMREPCSALVLMD